MARKSTAPAKAAKPKATAARMAEVDGYATVEQCGVELTIPLGANIPLEMIEIIAAETETPQGDFDEWVAEMAATKALIGPDQWEKFKAARPTLKDFRELSGKISALTGK